MITVTKSNNTYFGGNGNTLLLSFPYDKDTVEAIRELPNRKYLPSCKGWIIPAFDIPELFKLMDEDELDIQPEILNTMAEKTVTQSVAERLEGITPKVDFPFKTTCYPHQIEAFNTGITQNTLLLADDQGLGKTKESLDIMSYRYERGQIKKCLIVCGVNGTKYNWEKEIALHTDHSCAMIDGSSTAIRLKQIDKWLADSTLFGVINIEALRKKEIMEALNGHIDAAVVDEIHKAKNGRCQQGEAVRNLSAKYKIGMTGTPITSKAEDLWNILSWLGIERRNYYQFRDAYCEMGGYKQREIVGYKNLDSLNRELDSIMLRRKKEDVIDLPEKIYQTEYVEPPKHRKQNIGKLRKEF